MLTLCIVSMAISLSNILIAQENKSNSSVYKTDLWIIMSQRSLIKGTRKDTHFPLEISVE